MLVKSGVDHSGAVENVMGKDVNVVSDVAVTADGLEGVIAVRNKVMIRESSFNMTRGKKILKLELEILAAPLTSGSIF